jgi:hypothetical protein
MAAAPFSCAPVFGGHLGGSIEVALESTRYLAAIKQLAVVRKLVMPTPTTLDLLRYPLNESDGKTDSRNTRTIRPRCRSV